MNILVLTGEWELQTATSFFPLLLQASMNGKKKAILAGKLSAFFFPSLSHLH